MNNQQNEKPGTGQEIILHRNAFYRDGYRKMIGITTGILLALLLSAGGNLYFLTREPVIQSFGLTEDNRVIPLQPLGEAYVSPTALLKFAQESGLHPYNIDYLHYREQMAKLQSHFTKAGFQSFTEAYQASDVITLLLRKEQRILTAVPLAAPRIVKEGDIKGRYRWRIEMPIRLTGERPGDQRTADLLITMEIIRVSLNDHPKGIQVDYMLASPFSGRK